MHSGEMWSEVKCDRSEVVCRALWKSRVGVENGSSV